MKYTAPDGNIIESLPYPNEITYQCNCDKIPEGNYESIETTSSQNTIGIQQIIINRSVTNNIMTIKIRESSEIELQEYINNINT